MEEQIIELDELLFKKDFYKYIFDNFQKQICDKYSSWQRVFGHRKSIDEDFVLNHGILSINLSGNISEPLTLAILIKRQGEFYNILRLVLQKYHLSEKPDLKKFKTIVDWISIEYDDLENRNVLNIMKQVLGFDKVMTLQDFKSEWSDGDETKEKTIEIMDGLKINDRVAKKRGIKMFPDFQYNFDYFSYYILLENIKNKKTIYYRIRIKFIDNDFLFSVSSYYPHNKKPRETRFIKNETFPEFYDRMNKHLEFGKRNAEDNLYNVLQAAIFYTL